MRSVRTLARWICCLAIAACGEDAAERPEPVVEDALRDAGGLADGSAVAPVRLDGGGDALAEAPSPSGVTPPVLGAATTATAQLPASGAARLPRVESLPLTGLASVVLPARPDDVIGNGWGFGLVDADGDGDLDVLLSGSRVGPPACVFENLSVVGEVRFADRPLACLRGVDVIGAYAAALDADGRDALVVATTDGPLLWRFGPTPSQEALPTTDPPCIASNAQAIDLDSDGRMELVLACQHVVRVGRPTLRVRDQAWRRDERGEWTPIDEPWLRTGNTLALGVIDRNEDGRLDLAVVVDTFSSQVARNTREEPGGWATRCAPSDACRFRVDAFLDDAAAWGSFMGVGVVRVADALRIVLTDWGLNRLLPVSGDGGDEALERGVARRPPTDRDLFHWGVAVEDWNGDGLDDLFISQGTVPFASAVEAEGHADTLLLQTARGTFVSFSDAIGIPPLAGAGLDGAAARSRGIARADLDGDGTPELLIAPLEGPYRLLRILPPEGLPPSHCTLDVRPRFALASRAGTALAPSPTGPWHLRDVAGQHQVGTSPLVLSAWRTGAVRFASGAVVPFTCPPVPPLGAPVPAPVQVVEPDWVRVDFAAGEARVTIDRGVRGEVRSADAAVRRADGTVERRAARADTADTFVVPLSPNDVAVMWRFDRRWVDRWFLR